jgi:hypothetical protein
VLVEQYYDFAAELADQYLVMERGEIIARGRGADMEADGRAAVACRSERGDHRVRVRTQLDVDVQQVAADHAAGRMHQHVVADARALRIQRLQHAQRPFVAVVRHAALAVAPVAQLKAAGPGHRLAQKSRCSAAMAGAASGTGPTTSTAFWPRAKTSRQGRSSVGFSSWLPVSASRSRSVMP